MRSVRYLVIVSSLALFISFIEDCCAQDNSPSFPPTADLVQSRQVPILPVQKIAPGKYRLGDITINKSEKSLSFPAQVNMDKGLVEYLIVQNKGKTHESLLRTQVEPHHLNIACLLLGLEGTDTPLSMQGAPDLPTGDRVKITIERKGNDRIPAEKWLAARNGESMRPVETVDWVYTGSIVDQSRFIAQETGSIVAVYHDPGSLVDNASRGGESDEMWFVNEGAVPPVGTPVTVTIKPLK